MGTDHGKHGRGHVGSPVNTLPGTGQRVSDDCLKAKLRELLDHHQSGRLAQADTMYREMLAESQDYPDVLHSLGVSAYLMGNLQEAEGLLRRVRATLPENADVHNDFGLVLLALGKLD